MVRAGYALCAALVLAGCAADRPRSYCSRTEERPLVTEHCGFFDREGRCGSRFKRTTMINRCVEFRCKKGFNYGPNEYMGSLFRRGCLTKEEAEKAQR